MAKPLEKRLTRRKFLRTAGGLVLGAALTGVGGITYASRIEPDWLEIVSLNLTLPRLDPAFDGFRLVQISDIHISRALTGTDVADACQLVLDSKPDLVALTGDFIDEKKGFDRLLGDLTGALRPLVTKIQTVAVLGNHDYRMGSMLIRGMLRELGIQELDNQVLSLSRGSAHLHVAGVDDIWWGHTRLGQVLERMPEDGAAILMAHEPDYADASAQTGRFDLQISGHTHGGQVVLPGIGAPLLPFLGKKYPSGLYQVGRMFQYTNRGLGMTMPYIRFNCRPEITVFTLQSGES